MADPERITPGKTEDFQSFTGEAIPLGGQIIVTPRGEIMVTDAPGYMTLLAECENPEMSRIVFMLYRPEPISRSPGEGMVAQMTAFQARSIAGSLLKLADRLEPGSVN